MTKVTESIDGEIAWREPEFGSRQKVEPAIPTRRVVDGTRKDEMRGTSQEQDDL